MLKILAFSTGLRHLLLAGGQQTDPGRARAARAAAPDQAQRQPGRRPLRTRLQEQRRLKNAFIRLTLDLTQFMNSHDDVKYI